MRVAIHQAYFIPWLGYFSKLAYSDIFVVLDNVLFRKRHYFDRTKIINMHSEIRWLSLPVGQNFGIKCRNVNLRLPDRSYVNKIIRTIELSYAKAIYYDFEWNELCDVLKEPLLNYSNLVDINVAIIKNIINYLKTNMPNILFESNLIEDCEDSTDRIIKICNVLKAKSVVIGGGMSREVHDWQRVVDKGINIYIQNYLAKHPVYTQSRRKRAGFQKGLSIIDAILNVGRKQTTEFLVDNKYRPMLLELKKISDINKKIILKGDKL